MRNSANFWLLLASLLIGLFVANLVAGAFANASFLPDVGEMLVLLAACISFVVAVLQKERDALLANQTLNSNTRGDSK